MWLSPSNSPDLNPVRSVKSCSVLRDAAGSKPQRPTSPALPCRSCPSGRTGEASVKVITSDKQAGGRTLTNCDIVVRKNQTRLRESSARLKVKQAAECRNYLQRREWVSRHHIVLKDRLEGQTVLKVKNQNNLQFLNHLKAVEFYITKIPKQQTHRWQE